MITESAIASFNMFFDKIKNKKDILNFFRENLNNSIKNLEKSRKNSFEIEIFFILIYCII